MIVTKSTVAKMPKNAPDPFGIRCKICVSPNAG